MRGPSAHAPGKARVSNFGIDSLRLIHGLVFLLVTFTTTAEATLVSAVPAPAATIPTLAPASIRRVLVLYSDERVLPANVIVDSAIRETFAANPAMRVDFQSEFLDVTHFPGEEEAIRLRDFLREKYREHPPDLLLAAGVPALQFLLRYRAGLFPGVPIVYLGVPAEYLPKDLPDSRITGIPMVRAPASTVELALRLQPDTRHVAVVAGSSPQDQEMVAEFRREVPTFASRVDFLWLTDLSMADLRDRLAHLPDRTIVLYLSMFQDAAGASMIPREALALLAPSSRAPIYGFYETLLGYGVLGGSMVSLREVGGQAANLAMRILAGVDVQTAGRLVTSTPIPMFDGRELIRWKINEGYLPPGSVIKFRETSYWARHRELILGATLLVAIETFLIVTLLVQRTQRRRAEESLRESAEFMRLATEAGNVALWVWDVEQDTIWATPRTRLILGLPPEAPLRYEDFLAHVHRNDLYRRDRAIHHALRTLGNYAMEYRLLLADGEIRWMEDRGRALRTPDGRGSRLLGVSIDLTAQKLAEDERLRQQQELAHLSRVVVMGEMASSLAHELNQPLTGIVTNAGAGLRLQERGILGADELREILQDVVADGRRAGDIIRGIRSMVKKEDGGRTLLDVNDVVRGAVGLVRSDALARGCRVETKLATDLPPIEGNPVQLQQVLLNLVVNAFDAMQDLPVEDREVFLISEVNGASGEVRLSVVDQGPGIAEDSGRVFDQFFSTKREGLGMGLAIARAIVEAHGGKLTACPAALHGARGACFQFTLPAAQKMAVA